METVNIKNILIPLDFSETSLLALEHATFMARFYKADITLLHVIESAIFTSAITFHDTGNDLSSVIMEKANEKLIEFANKIQDAEGIKIQTKVLEGRIYKTIVEFANKSNTDIIVMGTHGVSGFREYIMGSNAYRIVAESDCPVLSVQTHNKKVGFTNIVLPIDDSLSSRQKVRYAANIASKYNAKIHIAALMTEEDSEFKTTFKIKISQVEEYLKNYNINYDTKYIHGSNLADMTLKYATDIKSDLIIIMTDQNLDYEFSGFMVSPFSQHIVNHSKIPVMSIKPISNDVEANIIQFGL
jgi:nucleotide-binding universal stress UspA family protein